MAQLTSETFTNLKKSVDGLSKNVLTNSKVLLFKTKKDGESSGTVTPLSSGMQAENKREGEKVQNQILEYLKQIAENTVQKSLTMPGKKFEFGIGKIALTLIAALGALIGFILTQIKSIVYGTKLAITIGKFLGQLANVLTKGKIIEAITNGLNAIKNIFNNLKVLLTTKITAGIEILSKAFVTAKDALKTRITKVVTDISSTLQNGFAKIKSFFKGGLIDDAFKGINSFITQIKSIFSGKMIGDIAKVFSTFFNNLANFAKPFKDIGTGILKVAGVVMQGVRTVGNFFAAIGKYLGVFAKLAGGLGIVISKIAYPLQLLYGAFVSIKAFITSLMSGDNVIEALGVAVRELYSAIVFQPLDLLKSMVSWVLGKLGFEQAEEFLDSFSFDDMFKSFIQKIKDAIAGIFGWIGEKLGLASKQTETGLATPLPEQSGQGNVIEDTDGNKQVIIKPKASKPIKKEDLGIGLASSIAPQPKVTGNIIDTASMEAEVTKSSSGSKGNSAIVNAPSTTINSATNNNLVKPPVRNVDPSLNSYYRQKYI